MSTPHTQPAPRGEPRVQPPLYFVCYSRVERDLVAKIEAKLAARHRRGELDLWRDVRSLDTWEEFTLEIQAALRRAAGAIVVVSDAWYRSDYIHQHEWPTIQALRAQDPAFGMFLLAFNDLDRDDPLRERNFVNDLREELLVGSDDEARDRVLTRLSDLVGAHALTRQRTPPPADMHDQLTPSLTVEPHSTPPAPPGGAMTQTPAPTLTTALDGVPDLPAQFVEPQELATLADLLTSGRRTVAGLFGEGGTGKSILAAAIAHRVAGHFPDGVHWVTLGEQATREDVRRAQVEVLARIGRLPEQPPRDLNEGTRLLVTALAGSAAMVVTDDVWHPWQARAFDVVHRDGRARLLYTTRFQETVPADAVTTEITRLGHEESAAFLGNLPLGLPDAPEDVAAVLEAAGGLRLALAVLSATAAVEGSWRSVLDRLGGLAVRFGKGDEASSAQKALFVAMDTLDADDRHRALMLGAFPPDVAVPVGLLADLWDVSRGAAGAVVERLVVRDVAVHGVDGVRLHDHVHDFFVLQADLPTSDVHLMVWELARARAAGGWAALADQDPYVWDRLVWHGCQAGLNRATLWGLVGDLGWLAERIRRHGAAAAQQDLARVCDTTAVGRDAPLNRLRLALRHGEVFDAAAHDVGLVISLEVWADAVGLARTPPRRLRYGSLLVPSSSLLRTLRGHTSEVLGVAAGPDGRRLATASADGTARIWDARTGEQITVCAGHADQVRGPAFSPDGRRLATVSADGTARIWDASTGEQVAVLTGHAGSVLAAAFSPDGARVATAGEDSTVRTWDVRTGEQVTVLTGHAGRVWEVAFSPDGARLATAGHDATARTWEASTGAQLTVMTGHSGPVRRVAFSPDGARLATGGDDRTARVWTAETGEQSATFIGHGGALWGVGFSLDGARLATAARDGIARVWDLDEGRLLRSFVGHTSGLNDLAISPDGTWVATGGDDSTARTWATDGQDEPDTSVSAAGEVHGLALSTDDRHLATAMGDGTVRVWDAATGDPLRTLTGHIDAAWAVCLTADGRRAVSGSEDGTVRVWDAATGALLHTLSGHVDQIWDVALSHDDRRAASAGEDQTVRVWDVDAGAPLRTLTGHTRQARTVAFSRDDAYLASAGDDGTIRIWDPATGEPLRTLAGHVHHVWDVAFSPHDDRLASAGEDGSVRIWDARTGEPLRVLTGHTGPVRDVAFRAGTEHLASAGGDGTVRLWDLRTGRCLLTLSLACSGAVIWRGDVLIVASGSQFAVIDLPPV